MRSMKKLYIFILALIAGVALPVSAQKSNKTLKVEDLSSNSSIEDVRDVLDELDIYLFDFNMTAGKFPTCDFMEAPLGCYGFSIINNEYVEGTLKISRKGAQCYDSGNYEAKKSGVRVKLRGNTSSYEDVVKKSYKLKLSKKADLLFRNDDFYKDKDWVLLGLGAQRLNHVAGTSIGRACGMPWEPTGVHVAVIMNNKYLGTFYLVEAISAGEHRVNIKENGFIVENDPYFWKPGEAYFQTENQIPQLGWTFKDPDAEDLYSNEIDDIKSVMNKADEALYNAGNIKEYLDLESFASWMLAHDIMHTLDGYGSNIYVVKQDMDGSNHYSSKLQMGPVWDFDSSIAINEEAHAPVASLEGFWYPKLFRNEEFVDIYKNKWNNIKDKVASQVENDITNYISANPDLYNARLIDLKFGLMDPEFVSRPEDDMTRVRNWFVTRMPVLEDVMVKTTALNPDGNDSGVDDIYDNPDGDIRYYRLDGTPATADTKGIIIRVDANGKASKIVN